MKRVAMLIFIPCRHEAELSELDANFCPLGGEEVIGFEWQGKSWNEQLPDAVILHWLAQSERREQVPLDSSEGVGLIAFEYAWKAFNQLYDGFGDSEATALAKVKLCLREYLDAGDFVQRNHELLNRLCHYVLKDDDKLNEEFEKIVVGFPYEPEERIRRILKRVNGGCKQLRSAMRSGYSFTVVQEMVRVLYALRNARIHGHYEAVSMEVPRHGPPLRRPLPTDEFKTILWLLRRLDVSLLAGKLKIPETNIRELVMSRTLQLISEIRKAIYRVEGVDRVTFATE
jgi:hypothetical protein